MHGQISSPPRWLNDVVPFLIVSVICAFLMAQG